MRRRHILLSSLLVQSAFAIQKASSRLPAFVPHVPTLAFHAGHRHSLTTTQESPRPLRLAPHSNGAMVTTCAASNGPAAVGRGPLAREEKVTHSYHGYVREDPYSWMKDDNWQQVKTKKKRPLFDVNICTICCAMLEVGDSLNCVVVLCEVHT